MNDLSFMRTEIGSEFWSVPQSERENELFAPDTAWFLSGRSALAAIIADVKKKTNACTVAMPSWCCDSMILPFVQAGLDVRFYPVFLRDGVLVQELARAEGCDILFRMDFFGFTASDHIPFTPAVVIRDVTHSLLSAGYEDADYQFGSLRKWCGVATGGFARGLQSCTFSPDPDYVELRRAAMQEKADYIAGESEDKSYLSLFSRAEEHLDQCGVACADEWDVRMAQKLDVELIRQRRRQNADVLLQEFGSLCVFNKRGQNDCPLFVPITLPQEQRDALRRFLIEREIYCPIHWPVSSYHVLNEQTAEIYRTELSLVCDQRYSLNDMDRIVEAVKAFFRR